MMPLACAPSGQGDAAKVSIGVKLKSALGFHAWISRALAMAIGTTGVLMQQQVAHREH